MKYIIDIDALKELLDFTACSKVDGQPLALINDVKTFIDKFPKEPLDIPKIVTREVIE